MNRISSKAAFLVASGLLASSLVGCGSILGFEDFTDARDASAAPPDEDDGGHDASPADATADSAADAQPHSDAQGDAVAEADAGVDGGTDSGLDASDANDARDTGTTLDSGKDAGSVAACTPLATAPCTQDASGTTIPGLPTTAIGICKPGTKTCSAAGQWGACTGAFGPKARDCESAADNDCDGKVDNTIDSVCECNAAHSSRTITGGPKNCECSETCSATHHWNVCTPPNACDCVAGATRTCTGASGCAGGTQTCATDRTWGTCNGAPNKATYCQDHDGDGFCAAAVACTSACPGSLSAEWKTGCATTDCDDTKATVTPSAPAACQPANVCKTGAITCTTTSSTCSETGNANGKVCGSNLTCSNGACNACAVGYTLCGTKCVSLTSDGTNCGACGQSCGGGACQASSCLPKTMTVSTAPIGSIAVLNGFVFFTTANDVRRCADATCSSVTSLVHSGYPKPLARSRNSQVQVLDEQTLSTYDASGTNTSVAWFDQGFTHAPFTEFDVAPNGVVFAIAGYSVARFVPSASTGSLTNYLEVFQSTHDDSTATNIAIVGNDDVYSSFGGLGSGLIKCNATTSSVSGQDSFLYLRALSQHITFRADNGALQYCTPSLSGCSTLLASVSRILTDDGTNVVAQFGNSMVSADPAAGGYKTILLDMTGAAASNESNLFTADASYVYFVKQDGVTIQRIRKF